MANFAEYNDKGLEKHQIASYQMDLKGQATLPVLCNYFQEIAGNHAFANGFGFDQMIKTKQIWVLTRLRVEMEKYPKWRDEIQIKTWIRNREKLVSQRDFVVLDKDGNKLGGALTSWMLLDWRTRRPKLVESVDLPIQMFPDEQAITTSLEKIMAISNANNSYLRSVEFQDLDVNQHVNNVKYIEWILAAFPFEFRKKHNVADFQINYLAELKRRDAVKVQSEE